MPASASSPRSTPPPPDPDQSWQARAACGNHPRLPSTAWDDTVGRRETAKQRTKRVGQAKTVCNTECPVRQQCFDEINLDEDYGVRGGADLRDLKRARRRRQARWAA